MTVIIADGETMPMNMKDIQNVLTFAFASDEGKYVLVCKTANDIPYVKRALLQTLGQPDKMIHNELYYKGRSFLVLPLSANLADFEDAYYIAYKDDSDWNELCANAGVKKRQVPYELMPWLTVGDIYDMLLRDGNSPATALHKMYIDGLISKGDDNESM